MQKSTYLCFQFNTNFPICLHIFQDRPGHWSYCVMQPPSYCLPQVLRGIYTVLLSFLLTHFGSIFYILPQTRTYILLLCEPITPQEVKYTCLLVTKSLRKGNNSWRSGKFHTATNEAGYIFAWNFGAYNALIRAELICSTGLHWRSSYGLGNDGLKESGILVPPSTDNHFVPIWVY